MYKKKELQYRNILYYTWTCIYFPSENNSAPLCNQGYIEFVEIVEMNRSGPVVDPEILIKVEPP
jgi:hypothetical protein